MLTIGRDPTNDLVLPDAMISRRHAVVEHRAGEFVLRDCRSANGSVVNGERVSERELRDGDVVALGSIRLQFREDPPASASGKVLVHPSALQLRCRACGADHARTDIYCRECGGKLVQSVEPPLRARCPECGNGVSLPARFCNECGSPLSEDADSASPARRDTGPLEPATDDAPSHVASGSMAMAPERKRLPAAYREHVAVPEGTGRRSRLASPGQRLAAAAVDAVFVTAGQAVMLAPVGWYWWTQPVARTPGDVAFLPVLASVALFPLALLGGALYHVYFWSVRGATPGKELLQLRVETAEGGSPIPVGCALLRLLGYLLGLASLGLGFLPILFGSGALHDRVARTRVARGPAR
jgi:uncharacterized RDD family membrane protein YckC